MKPLTNVAQIASQQKFNFTAEGGCATRVRKLQGALAGLQEAANVRRSRSDSHFPGAA